MVYTGMLYLAMTRLYKEGETIRAQVRVESGKADMFVHIRRQARKVSREKLS